MKLADLDPRWLVSAGKRLGIIFKCPHCRQVYLSCFFVPTPKFGHSQGEVNQFDLFEEQLGLDMAYKTVPCRNTSKWSCTPPVDEATFVNISISPSLNASASGHWHGFVREGHLSV